MKTSSIVIAAAALAVCAASQAQGQVFGQRTYTGMYTYNHADLNNDGREDLIYHTQTGFAVDLSTGGATYAAPVSYNVPDNVASGTVTLDMNNDGKLDVIAFNGLAPGFYEYLNTGAGGLNLQSTYQLANIQDMVVGDFNHDGYADLAVLTTATAGNGGTLHVLFNNHAGGFTAGPTTSASALGQMSVGDFDGDGAADLAVSSPQSTYLFFGDNTGNFTAKDATTSHHAQSYLMDLDGDGKSDLVGVAVAGSNGMTNTYYRDVWVVWGDQFRDLFESGIPLNGYAVAWTSGTIPEKSPSVDVADFNGDGFTDFAVVEAQNSDGTGTRTLAVKLGQLSRQWSSEVNVYSSSELDFGVAAIRATNALKPDLLVDTFANNTQTAHFFVNDSSGGYFGGCEYPNTAIGIQVCSPTTYGSTSVSFDASAAGQTTMRKVEVWVDGVKKYQETARHAYSHYGLLDATMTLSAGTHHVTIIAAGYDNLEVKKSYTVTVQ
jgi:hypothetical protein